MRLVLFLPFSCPNSGRPGWVMDWKGHQCFSISSIERTTTSKILEATHISESQPGTFSQAEEWAPNRGRRPLTTTWR